MNSEQKTTLKMRTETGKTKGVDYDLSIIHVVTVIVVDYKMTKHVFKKS